MQQAMILAKEVEHVARTVLPYSMPAARIGILRGMWQNWQKHWEIVGTQRDEERIRAYARTIDAGQQVQDALVNLYRSTDRLRNIDAILAADRSEFTRKQQISERQHTLAMTTLDADISLANRRKADAEAQQRLGGATQADAARMKSAQVAEIGRDFAKLCLEVDSDGTLPNDVKEVMRAQLRGVFEQACREITGVITSARESQGNGSTSSASKDEAVRRRQAHRDADVSSVMNSTMLSDAEKREKVRSLHAECEDDCRRIKES